MDPKGLGGALPTRDKDLEEVKNDAIPDEILQKMQEMVLEDPEQFVASLPDNVKSRVEALKELFTKFQQSNNSYLEEVKALQLKYQDIYAPILKERQEIISGSKAVEGAQQDDGGIPNFWVNALTKSLVVGETVQERDLPVLAHLTDITTRLLEGKDENGFQLIFSFEENPFFENKELVKTYIMADMECTVLKEAKGTQIQWKEGKDVTKKVMKRKVKPGQVVSGPMTKVVKAESFFNLFSPPPIPQEPEDVPPDQLQELQMVLEADYEVGSTIREKIIPMAVLYYTGEARQLDEEEGLDDFEDDEDDEDDEEGENGQEEQECKQQ